MPPHGVKLGKNFNFALFPESAQDAVAKHPLMINKERLWPHFCSSPENNLYLKEKLRFL